MLHQRCCYKKKRKERKRTGKSYRTERLVLFKEEIWLFAKTKIFWLDVWGFHITKKVQLVQRKKTTKSFWNLDKRKQSSCKQTKEVDESSKKHSIRKSFGSFVCSNFLLLQKRSFFWSCFLIMEASGVWKRKVLGFESFFTFAKVEELLSKTSHKYTIESIYPSYLYQVSIAAIHSSYLYHPIVYTILLIF